jgi:hypothetical protein
LSYRSVGPVKSPLRSSFLASQLPRRFLPAVAEPLPPRPDPAKCALCDPCQRLGPVFSIGFPVRFVKCISRAPPRHQTQRSSVGRPPAAGTSGSEAGAQGAEEPGKTEPCRHYRKVRSRVFNHISGSFRQKTRCLRALSMVLLARVRVRPDGYKPYFAYKADREYQSQSPVHRCSGSGMRSGGRVQPIVISVLSARMVTAGKALAAPESVRMKVTSCFARRSP